MELRYLNSSAMSRFKVFLLGFFLHSRSVEVTEHTVKILREIVKKDVNFAPSVLCVVLYKIGKDLEPELLNLHLRLLAQLSVHAVSFIKRVSIPFKLERLSSYYQNPFHHNKLEVLGQ